MNAFSPLFRAFGFGRPAPEPDSAPALEIEHGLEQPDAFFAALRDSRLFGPTLSQAEVDGCNAILGAFAGLPVSFAAYGLATAYHETARTMQPIMEHGGAAYFTRMYDPKGERPEVAAQLGNVRPGDGARYCGRGYVQLTGRANYAKAGRALGCGLEAHPELALDAGISAQVLRRGLVEGWFTGKSLYAYLPSLATEGQFTAARRTVNGNDCAELIAGYAVTFQHALQAGRWA